MNAGDAPDDMPVSPRREIVDRYRVAARLLVLQVDDNALRYRLARIKEERDSVFLTSLPTYPLLLEAEEIEIEHELTRRQRSRQPRRADVSDPETPHTARAPPPKQD